MINCLHSLLSSKETFILKGSLINSVACKVKSGLDPFFGGYWGSWGIGMSLGLYRGLGVRCSDHNDVGRSSDTTVEKMYSSVQMLFDASTSNGSEVKV